jgi:hypothetical protein
MPSLPASYDHRLPAGSGVTDLRGLATALDTRGVRTARGVRWRVYNVKNVIDRVALL